MKITKAERAVIDTIREIGFSTARKLGKQYPEIEFEDLDNASHQAWKSIARWHLATLKEARADGYMGCLLKSAPSHEWKLNMSAPIGKPCDAPKKGRK